MVQPLVQGTKECIKDLCTSDGDTFGKLSSDMESMTAYGFQELTEEGMTRFMQQVYHPYLTALTQHLESRFPDVALLEAFNIFDPVVMEKQSQSELHGKLQIITAHYGPHNVLDSDSTICEYQCFSRSVLSTPHLKKSINKRFDV